MEITIEALMAEGWVTIDWLEDCGEAEIDQMLSRLKETNTHLCYRVINRTTGRMMDFAWMKPVAIFRFSPDEGPGYFRAFLDAQGIPWRLIAIDQGRGSIRFRRIFWGLYDGRADER